MTTRPALPSTSACFRIPMRTCLRGSRLEPSTEPYNPLHAPGHARGKRILQRRRVVDCLAKVSRLGAARKEGVRRAGVGERPSHGCSSIVKHDAATACLDASDQPVAGGGRRGGVSCCFCYRLKKRTGTLTRCGRRSRAASPKAPTQRHPPQQALQTQCVRPPTM